MNAGTTNKNSGKTVKVRQVGSPLRREHTQRETLIGLKLNKIGAGCELEDSAVGARNDCQGRASSARRGLRPL